jgi:hypothetical protein
MKRILALFACTLLATSAASENHFQDLARDALRDAQRFNDYTRDRAEEVLSIPVETDLPQSDMSPGDLEDGGILAATGDTVQGRAYTTFSDGISNWGVAAADQGDLALADGAVADPNAIIDPDLFETSGGICTVDEFEDGPVFERVCTSIRDISTVTCEATAEVSVLHTATFECEGLVGFAPECEALVAYPTCGISSQECLVYLFPGQCLDYRWEYTCSTETSFNFPNTQIGPTETSDPIVTWNETCPAEYDPLRCTAGETTCTSGPTVVDIGGVLVPLDCAVQETAHQCASNTYSSDCDVFEADASCSLLSSECYDLHPDGICGAYENTFRCGSATSQDFDASCEAVNVCVGETCQSIPNEQNTDIGDALLGVEILNTLVQDNAHNFYYEDIINDPDALAAGLQYFAARRRSCRIGILGTLNCCRDSGWALGTIAECNEDEVELFAAQEAGTAVYQSTYCSEHLVLFCAQRSRRYCIFNSKIARIISEQGQEQIYGFFACRSLTQEELEQIDFSQIDFADAFGDLFDNVGEINPTDLSGLVQDNILLAQPEVRDVYE